MWYTVHSCITDEITLLQYSCTTGQGKHVPDPSVIIIGYTLILMLPYTHLLVYRHNTLSPCTCTTAVTMVTIVTIVTIIIGYMYFSTFWYSFKMHTTTLTYVYAVKTFCS